jgi:hypothetical protein
MRRPWPTGGLLHQKQTKQARIKKDEGKEERDCGMNIQKKRFAV